MLLPNQWLEQLPPATIAAEMVRRCGLLNGGHVWRGVLLAWLWNLAGFATVALLPVTDLDTAPGLVNQALAFTLWSFLGLLVLPSLSRPAEHAADLYALKAGVPKDSLVKALGDIDAICNRNPSLPSLVESIFHPVPSLHKRPLTSPPLPQGAWKASRIALLMSWAGLGLLGRAVHTNVGLPEQWVW
jgi:hypothetical protein